ncbi:MAG TPA: ATP-binding protein [Verrucomicrobiae bacterium]|nr:ATP-binding protein [Verrucomicrobiae bacterium]
MNNSGRLRIGDDWHAITIIALSQQNPLKAVAEFVENSIDAKARNITITRGREKGQHFLRIKDDGEGVPRDAQGLPDFQYVATHICDSIKRQLKHNGSTGVQGEFGIGLLSFWTVGEELLLASAAGDGRTYQMHMRKGNPKYEVKQKGILFAEGGTELTVRPLLPGIRQFSGEKLQWYLASELRDRIRQSGVQIRIVDRTARAEFKVEPRQFEGRLLHQINRQPSPQTYLELYLNPPGQDNVVGLYRAGTRVLENICELAMFSKPPWNSGYLQGMVDAGYLNLTPGTRTGVIQDETLARLAAELQPLEEQALRLIDEQRRAEEEQTSRDVLRSIQKALKEAILTLPAEEYDWFNIREGEVIIREGAAARSVQDTAAPDNEPLIIQETSAGPSSAAGEQKQFFEYPGPLFSARISPGSVVLPVNGTKNLRAVPRDRAQRLVEDNLDFRWTMVEGEGRLEKDTDEIATFHAPAEPGLTRIRVAVTQGDVSCQVEALVTVTQSLLPPPKEREVTREGIPAYTFQRAPGELWRSRLDAQKNLIVVNSGHRDFVYAARHKALKLRYISRLYAKELVLRNFVGVPAEQLLERLIELSLYTEENLK